VNKNFPQHLRHLSTKSKKFYRWVVSSYQLEEHHLELLKLLCEALDTGEKARIEVEKQGMTYMDKFGQPKARPECKVVNDSAILAARLLRELALDADLPEEYSRPKRGRSYHG
jgi:phage terminase small subunit